MRQGFAVVGPDGRLLDVTPDPASAAHVAQANGFKPWIEEELPGQVDADELSGAELGGLESMPRLAARATFVGPIRERDVMNMSLDEAYMRLQPFFPSSGKGSKLYSKPRGMAEALLGQNYKTAKTVKAEDMVEYSRVRTVLRERYGVIEAQVQGLSLVPHFLMRGSAAGPEFAYADRLSGGAVEQLAAQRGLKVNQFTLCAGATKECRASCLVYAGHNTIDPYNVVVKFSRTKALMLEPVAFARMLMESVAMHTKRMRKAGLAPMFRLNVFSDLPWELVFEDAWFFRAQHQDIDFGGIQFYDYTKVAGRRVPENYDLTFSYAGAPNASATKFEHGRHKRIAVVFLMGSAEKGRFGIKKERKTPMPSEWCGFKVVDGDISDMRPLDPPGVVVGLRWKIPMRQGIDPGNIAFVTRVWDVCGALVTTQSARQEPIVDADEYLVDDV